MPTLRRFNQAINDHINQRHYLFGQQQIKDNVKYVNRERKQQQQKNGYDIDMQPCAHGQQRINDDDYDDGKYRR